MNKYEVEIYSMGKVEANLLALSLLFVPIMWPSILIYIVDEICDKFSRYKFLKNIKICIKFEDREDMILISKLKNQKDLSYLTKPGFIISREFCDDNFEMNDGREVKNFILDVMNPNIITTFTIQNKFLTFV